MKKYYLLWIIFCLSFSVACTQVTPLNTEQTRIPYQSPRPTSTVISLPTQSLGQPENVPNPIATLTNTTSPITTPGWTPRPTLPAAQAREFSLKMVQTNNGCILPCWLGIIPGQTSWIDANAFLATFATSISVSNDLESGVHAVTLEFPDKSYGGTSTIVATFRILGDGLVHKILVPVDLSLPDLLATYGVPSEIRLHAIGIYTVEPVGRFTLVLFYQEKGIMAVYDGTSEKGKVIDICPSSIKNLQREWVLWDPTEKTTFMEAGKATLLITNYPQPGENDYIPVEKLTNLSNDAFTKRYQDPRQQDICMRIKTPD